MKKVIKIRKKIGGGQKKFIFNKFYSEDIYKVDLDFFAGEREEIAKLIKKKYGYEIKNNCLGEHVVFDGKNNEIRNLIWVGDVSNFYTLSHELIHLVKCIFERDGIPFNIENDETIAYYHTYWFRRIWHDINLFCNKNGLL